MYALSVQENALILIQKMLSHNESNTSLKKLIVEECLKWMSSWSYLVFPKFNEQLIADVDTTHSTSNTFMRRTCSKLSFTIGFTYKFNGFT